MIVVFSSPIVHHHFIYTSITIKVLRLRLRKKILDTTSDSHTKAAIKSISQTSLLLHTNLASCYKCIKVACHKGIQVASHRYYKHHKHGHLYHKHKYQYNAIQTVAFAHQMDSKVYMSLQQTTMHRHRMQHTTGFSLASFSTLLSISYPLTANPLLLLWHRGYPPLHLFDSISTPFCTSLVQTRTTEKQPLI